MRFSLRLNNDLPLELYPRLAGAAERLGFDQFWVSDDLFLRSVWVILAAVARATERIGIGTCIVNPYTIHPAELAMTAATLDELSGGRLHLGISSGADDFLGWIGLRAERPVTAVAETTRALRHLFAGGRGLPADGAFLRDWTGEAYLRFPSRPIPIYLGAMSPRMLRLIGQEADGGLPLLFPPEHYQTVIGYIQEGAAEARRSVDALDVAACIWCSISTDRAAAETVMRDKIAYYGHALSPLILKNLGVQADELVPSSTALMVDRDPERARALVPAEMLRIGVVGTAADLVPRLERLVGLGVRHVSFGPPLGPDPLTAIEVLGREVLPHLRGLGV
ncbi:MAG TPA: LLM class flavin-dependent oxidoreductase [Actinomycetes bacterium]